MSHDLKDFRASTDDYLGSVCLLVNRQVEVLIDVADFETVIAHRWTVMAGRNTFYVVRGNRDNKLVRLHRQLLNAPENTLGDHKNLNGLDNRRKNLRPCSHSENNFNARLRKDNPSGHKGVFQYPSGSWGARIWKNGRRFYLGVFQTAIEAHGAHARAAAVLHGEFARAV